MEYDLDEEGYVIVNFSDMKIKDTTPKKEKKAVKLGAANEFILPIRLEKIVSKVPTKTSLMELEYTDLLRVATREKFSTFIQEHFQLRGLPLKEPYILYPHQIETLRWMRDKESKIDNGIRGGIVRLEPGLGKTLTSLTHILTSPKGEFPTLVVCSKTIMREWRTNGIEKFFGSSIKVLYLHKGFIGNAVNAVTRSDILKYDLVITTYDACSTTCKKGDYFKDCLEMGDDHTLMKGRIVAIHLRSRGSSDNPKLSGLDIIYGTPWERVICDESQRFANPSTQTYKYILAIYGRYKWCLSGTPIRNYDSDIWAQLRYCGYNGVTSKIEWDKNGTQLFEKHRLKESIFSMNYDDAKITLPLKIEQTISCSLTGNQKAAYDFVIGITKNAYDQMMQKLCSFACVLALFTRLRQCSIAPYLLTAQSKREKLKGEEKKADQDALNILKNLEDTSLGKWCHDKSGDTGIKSSKITTIISLLKKIPKGQKVLIYSMFTSCLDLLSDAIDELYPEFKHLQMDGDTADNDRDHILYKFKNEATVRGLFLTYKVGSEGLNLTEGNHCIFIEPWWTDAVHSQALRRIYRLGQMNKCYIYRIMVQDSVEEHVIAICEEKKKMAASYLDGTKRDMKKGVGSGLDKYTLGKILGVRH